MLVRPMLATDVEAADDVAWSSISTSMRVYERRDLPDRDDAAVARARTRIAHLQRTDPDSAWLAVDGDQVVGLALALRRGPMWFLSLLAVKTDLQSRGTGKALLEAATRTSEGATRAWICSTPDPKALRRYALAGFRVHAALMAEGPVDRSLLPSGLGVRDGDWSSDRHLVDQVAERVRGASYGPDVDAIAAVGAQLAVVDDGADRGYCIRTPSRIVALGATSEAVAQRLLWDVLGRLEGECVTVEWLTAGQQWAVDVALAARLPLLAGPPLCLREGQPPVPYLPGGAYG